MYASQRSFLMAQDHAILTVWRAQIAAAATPQIKQRLTRQERELLPRFADYYRTLQHLSRRARRSLQRQWKQPLAGVALLLTLGQAPALAATINVGGNAQTQAIIPLCTLVDAITAANADTATGGCPAGSGADDIVLPAGSTHTLVDVNNTYHHPYGLPVITSDITIQGNNSTIMRASSAPAFSILAVIYSGNLTLQQVTVSGGVGGIGNSSGTLTLTNSMISGNSGHGLFGRYGTSTLTNSSVSGNSGSGLSVRYSVLTLTDSTVSGNSGSGVFGFYAGRVTMNNTMISDNDSYGVFIYRGATTLTNCTVSGNSGRGLTSQGFANTLLVNTTVSGNLGTGVYIDFNSSARLVNSTVTGNAGGGIDNSSGRLQLVHSVISGNTGSLAPEVTHTIGGSITVNNFNIFGHDGNPGVSGFSPSLTDIVPSGPVSSILSPLADNGGPTRTHNLVLGGSAVDAFGQRSTRRATSAWRRV